MKGDTAQSRKRSKLTRLRRGRESDSPPAASSSKRRNAVLSDDDLDAEDLELPARGGIQDIWAEEEEDEEDEEERRAPLSRRVSHKGNRRLGKTFSRV